MTPAEALEAECAALIRDPDKGRIAAIKHVRTVLRLPLEEARDWVMALNVEPVTRDEMLEKAHSLRQQAGDLVRLATDYEERAASHG